MCNAGTLRRAGLQLKNTLRSSTTKAIYASACSNERAHPSPNICCRGGYVHDLHQQAVCRLCPNAERHSHYSCTTESVASTVRLCVSLDLIHFCSGSSATHRNCYCLQADGCCVIYSTRLNKAPCDVAPISVQSAHPLGLPSADSMGTARCMSCSEASAELPMM